MAIELDTICLEIYKESIKFIDYELKKEYSKVKRDSLKIKNLIKEKDRLKRTIKHGR